MEVPSSLFQAGLGCLSKFPLTEAPIHTANERWGFSILGTWKFWIIRCFRCLQLAAKLATNLCGWMLWFMMFFSPPPPPPPPPATTTPAATTTTTTATTTTTTTTYPKVYGNYMEMFAVVEFYDVLCSTTKTSPTENSGIWGLIWRCLLLLICFYLLPVISYR